MRGAESGTDYMLIRSKLKLHVMRRIRTGEIKALRRIDVLKLRDSKAQANLINVTGVAEFDGTCA